MPIAPRWSGCLCQPEAKNPYGLLKFLRADRANREVSFRDLPRLKKCLGFIQRRPPCTVSQAYVRTEINQKLYELRRVKNNAALNDPMNRSVALLVPPVRVRPMFQQDTRDFG